MSARLARFLAKHANADSAESAIRPYRHQTEQTASACFELPDAPCADCGGGDFTLPPEGSWRCASCHPASGAAGWSFCSLPTDAASAPIARCSGCRFTAPLSARRLCGACEVKRLLAAGQRAANPNLASDPAELMLQPGGQS